MFLRPTIAQFLNENSSNGTIRLLVPIDLLDIPTDRLKQKPYHEDMQLLVARINQYFNYYNISQDNDVRAYFNALLPAVDVVTDVINPLPKQATIEGEIVAVAVSSNTILRGQNDEEKQDEEMDHQNIQSSNASTSWLIACCDTCCYTCYCVINAFGNSYATHNQNVGTTQAMHGEDYHGGVAGFFNGNLNGWLQGWVSVQEYNGCRSLCGTDVANICCCGYEQNQATASAMSGGAAPSGCWSFVNGSWCAFEETRCNENFFQLWTGCFSQLGQLFLGAADSLEHIVGVVGHGAGDVFHLLSDIVSTIGRCNIGEIDEDAQKFLATAIAGLVTAFGYIYSHLEQVAHARRLIESGVDQTDARFIPSMIAMTFSILLFLPRILLSLALIYQNLSQGIAVRQNLRLLAAEFIIGLPVALCAAFVGGASGWTYTSLVLFGMYVAYACESMYSQKIKGKFADACYFSSIEWRNIPQDTDVIALVERQENINNQLITVAGEKKNNSITNKVLNIAYPQLLVFWARQKMASEITELRNTAKPT